MLTYQLTDSIQFVADGIATKIIQQLQAGRKVLWLVPGGSSIAVSVLAAQQITKIDHSGLAVSLTDERYGPMGHPDSNWQQLIVAGFSLPAARLLPVLTGKDRQQTTIDFAAKLKEELAKADYTLGFFGIGSDGHTSGILPHSPAVRATEFAVSYDGPDFERITTTPQFITQLNEAVVFAVGKEKWPTLRTLAMVNDIDVQPAQVLKQVPQLTIYSDYTEGAV